MRIEVADNKTVLYVHNGTIVAFNLSRALQRCKQRPNRGWLRVAAQHWASAREGSALILHGPASARVIQ